MEHFSRHTFRWHPLAAHHQGSSCARWQAYADSKISLPKGEQCFHCLGNQTSSDVNVAEPTNRFGTADKMQMMELHSRIYQGFSRSLLILPRLFTRCDVTS